MTIPGLLTAGLLLLLAAPAGAASGPASLACTAKAPPRAKKAKGEGQPQAVSLRGLIPATAQALDLTLTSGGRSIALTSEAGDRVAVVEAFADRVFALVVFRPKGPSLRLYARPQTIKVRKETHAVHARFDAILLEAPPLDPSEKPGDGRALSGPVLSCLYDYEV